MTIRLINVSKRIKHHQVLDNVSFNFEKGKIYGLVGRNGSGKTMLIRALSGLLIPTTGKVIVDNQVLHDGIDFPPSLGVTIENTSFPKDLTGLQNLVSISKIKKVATIDDIKTAFQKVGLSENDWNTKVAYYSLGMRQKLSIAQAIFENPKLLLLDEPTNGLDEDSTWILRKTLKDLSGNGTTIILASHNKEDINLLSDVILKIDNGRIAGTEKSEWA